MCLSVGKFQYTGSHVVVVWVRGTVLRLWRKREEIARASCTTVLLYHFQVDIGPVYRQTRYLQLGLECRKMVQQRNLKTGRDTSFGKVKHLEPPGNRNLMQLPLQMDVLRSRQGQICWCTRGLVAVGAKFCTFYFTANETNSHTDCINFSVITFFFYQQKCMPPYNNNLKTLL